MNETNNYGTYPSVRPRRNRAQSFSRRMVAENQLDPSQLIQPYFVIEGDTTRQTIQSMPDVERLGISELLKEAEQAYRLGIPQIRRGRRSLERKWSGTTCNQGTEKRVTRFWRNHRCCARPLHQPRPGWSDERRWIYR